MLRITKDLKLIAKKMEKDVRGSDGKLCFSKRNEVKSKRIIWKGSRMNRTIGILMWK